MCGILAVLGCSDDSQAKRVRVLELSRRQSLHFSLSLPLFLEHPFVISSSFSFYYSFGHFASLFILGGNWHMVRYILFVFLDFFSYLLWVGRHKCCDLHMMMVIGLLLMFSCNLSLPWPMGPGPPGHILRVSLMWDQFTFFFPEKCQTGTVIAQMWPGKCQTGIVSIHAVSQKVVILCYL